MNSGALKKSIINSLLHSKKTNGFKRSQQWRAVREKFLEIHGKCEACSTTTNLEVHHIIPFFVNPEIELDESNLITLCESKKPINCHLVIGHLGNYRSFNPTVKEDAAYFNKMLKRKSN